MAQLTKDDYYHKFGLTAPRNFVSYYNLLGIQSTANKAQIRRAITALKRKIQIPKHIHDKSLARDYSDYCKITTTLSAGNNQKEYNYYLHLADNCEINQYLVCTFIKTNFFKIINIKISFVLQSYWANLIKTKRNAQKHNNSKPSLTPNIPQSSPTTIISGSNLNKQNAEDVLCNNRSTADKCHEHTPNYNATANKSNEPKSFINDVPNHNIRKRKSINQNNKRGNYRKRQKITKRRSARNVCTMHKHHLLNRGYC